jgi:DNA mismatch repair protein MutS
MAKAKKEKETLSTTGGDTPLMKQYNQIKSRYPGALLLFRIGDFYETFGEDAVITSQILGIVLTKRNSGYLSELPLAGFPHHSLDTYLPKLVRAGQRVAICDQLEDPALAKGIVKRGVTEIISPGTALSEQMLDQTQNNYLCAIHLHSSKEVAAAFLEVSTGDFFCIAGTLDRVEKVFYALRPSEVVVARRDIRTFHSLFGTDHYIYRFEDWAFEYKAAFEKLCKHFGVHSLKGYGLEDEKTAIIPAGVLLYYLDLNEQHHRNHIQNIYLFTDNTYVTLDKFTIRNLELIQPLFPDGKSLAESIDMTATPMGSRLLKRYLLFPLQNKNQLLIRQQKISALFNQPELLAELAGRLKAVGDPERLTARAAMRKITPREVIQLLRALTQSEYIMQLLAEINALSANAPFKDWLTHLPDIKPARELLQKYILPEPSNLIGQGKVIATGISAELDELRNLQAGIEQALQTFQKQEIEATGITSLKVDYNKIYGFYIEISHANRSRVPPHYQRRQTLTNAERYITPELKTFEEKILTANDQIAVLENELYQRLLTELQPYIAVLQHNAQLLAELDFFQSAARLALRRKYCMPEIVDYPLTEILAGRHPVIEQLLPPDKPYVPNDVYIDPKNIQILIITGPNMAGKSALLRQTALITLLAQTGMMVPATSAKIGIVDKIFTRVGAADNLSAGESTFMVEMNESARILNSCTDRSLILFDEVGRGTSTYDGVSIAWAMIEFLHRHPHKAAQTLFATHYHELAELENQLPRVKNFNVSVQEIEGKILFIRKLQPGSSEHSFGIQVAQMAGMPPAVVHRARELLAYFENRKTEQHHSTNLNPIHPIKSESNSWQLKLFSIEDELSSQIRALLGNVDIDRITPVEALLRLQQIIRLINAKR